MVKYINTIADLEAATYGTFGGTSDVLKSGGSLLGLHTAHDTNATNAFVGTAAANLSNLYNVIYGQKVWSMLNQEINPLSILPKRPYSSSGWRVLIDRPAGGSAAAFAIGTQDITATPTADMSAPSADSIGGVKENHALNSVGLSELSPEYATLFMSPKTVAHMFGYSEVAAEMAKIDDGIGDIRNIVREDMGKFHAEVQSKMLVMPLENYDHTSYADIELNYTSLLKIVASSQEMEAMIDAGMHGSMAGASTTGGLIDQMSYLYGNNSRDLVANAYNTSYMDSYVNYGAGYAAGDVRALTLTLINNTLQNLRVNGGTPKVILTGYDTIQTLGDLLQAQERFMERKEIVPSHNGVRGTKGREVGFRVATYFDIPLIPSKDMCKTGEAADTDQISDMLFLDTDHLWLAVMKPTQYFEDGINSGNPFGVGALGNKAMFRTMGETGCTFFKGQGKLTNLQ